MAKMNYTRFGVATAALLSGQVASAKGETINPSQFIGGYTVTANGPAPVASADVTVTVDPLVCKDNKTSGFRSAVGFSSGKPGNAYPEVAVGIYTDCKVEKFYGATFLEGQLTKSSTAIKAGDVVHFIASANSTTWQVELKDKPRKVDFTGGLLLYPTPKRPSYLFTGAISTNQDGPAQALTSDAGTRFTGGKVTYVDKSVGPLLQTAEPWTLVGNDGIVNPKRTGLRSFTLGFTKDGSTGVSAKALRDAVSAPTDTGVASGKPFIRYNGVQ